MNVLDIIEQEVGSEANVQKNENAPAGNDASITEASTVVEEGGESQQPEQPQQSTQKETASSDISVQETAPNEKVANDNSENQRKVFASDDVAELNAYLLKNPEKSFSDWQSLKTPTSDIDPKVLLRKFYSDKEKMSEKEIEYKMSQMEVDIDDEDDFGGSELSDSEKLKREALLEGEMRKAREWRESYVAEQLGDLDKSLFQAELPQGVVRVEELEKQWAEQKQKANQHYLETIYGALPEIKSIDVSVGGEQVSFVTDDSFISELKTVAEAPHKLYEDYQNEDGSIKNQQKWLEFLAWANESTRNKMIDFKVEQAITRDRILRSNGQRNVTQEVQGVVKTGNTDGEFEEWYSEQRRQQF